MYLGYHYGMSEVQPVLCLYSGADLVLGMVRQLPHQITTQFFFINIVDRKDNIYHVHGSTSSVTVFNFLFKKKIIFYGGNHQK